jgi:hypothetical protein
MRMLLYERECTYNAVEGDSGFPGYDYYQNSWLFYSSLGFPLYFQYTNCSSFGVSLEFAIQLNSNTKQGNEYCCRGYEVFNDEYTWPIDFFLQPACPFTKTFGVPTVSPSLAPIAISSSTKDSQTSITLSQGELSTLIILPTFGGMIFATILCWFWMRSYSKPLS